MTGPTLVAIDTETTGVRSPWIPGGRRVWDVGLVVRQPDGSEREYQWYVSDVDLSDADPYALGVGRFFSRHPALPGNPGGGPGEAGQHALTEKGVAVSLFRIIPRGAHIIGAVPDFDVQSLHEMAFRHQLPWVAHYHLIDVEALAVGYLNGVTEATNAIASDMPRDPGPSLPWKSDDLSRACGVEPPGEDERHTALGDARWAMRLYDAITGGAQ